MASTFSYCSSVVSSTEVRLDAGVVDHDVEAAKSFDRGIDQALQLGGVAHIRLHADDLVPKRNNLLLQSFGGLGMRDVVNDDVRALFGPTLAR